MKMIESIHFVEDSHDRPPKVAVNLFLLATLFMVMFSTNAIQRWIPPWNYIFFLSIWSTLIIAWLKCKPFPIFDLKLVKPIIICSVLLLLGGLNIFYSEAKVVSAKSIIIFMFSGPVIWGVATCFLQSRKTKVYFFKFLTLLLLLCCIYGCLELFIFHRIYLLSNNSISAGSIILLSLMGPFGLYFESPKISRIFLIICMMVGIIMVVLIGKRGAVLGTIVMLLAGAGLLRNRLSIMILAGTIVLSFIGFTYREYLPGELNRHFITSDTSQQRIENIFFAWHLFQKKPFVGYGLSAPISSHLDDYKETLREKNYTQYMNELKGFDNIFLTGFVMVGSLFSFIYLWFMGFLIYRYIYGDNIRKKTKLILILPLFAFLIQSMTYDSLLFPNVNWLFHVILGSLSGYWTHESV